MSFALPFIRRGDPWSWNVQIALESGTLAGSKVWFGIKKNRTDADDAATSIVVNSEDDPTIVQILDTENVSISLTSAQTVALVAGVNFPAIQIKPPGEDPFEVDDLDDTTIVREQVIQATA